MKCWINNIDVIEWNGYKLREAKLGSYQTKKLLFCKIGLKIDTLILSLIR